MIIDSYYFPVSKEEVGRKKRRLVVNNLLEMTLDQELETSLLWDVAKGFDLPLVIGEQFICTVKGRTFQSASYTDCLEYILTTLYEEEEKFAVDIWDKLIRKLNGDHNSYVKKCHLAFHGFSCETRKSHFHEYKNCFVGRQAVDWLVRTRICVSEKPREEAVDLGNKWIRRGFIKHVDNGGRDFEDEKGVFYRFDEKVLYKELREMREAHKKGNTQSDLEMGVLYDAHQISPQQMKGTPSSSYHNKDIIAYNGSKIKAISPIKKKRSITLRDMFGGH